MNSRKMFKIIIGLVAGIICCVCLLGLVRWSIQSGLDRQCEIAKATYPDCDDAVAAMLEYAQSQSHTLRQRNLAIWALGQARDSRALPVIESYLSGQRCEHGDKLCQRELEKAIMLCKSGSPNLLHIKVK